MNNLLHIALFENVKLAKALLIKSGLNPSTNSDFLELEDILKDNPGWLFAFTKMHFDGKTSIGELKTQYDLLLKYRHLFGRLHVDPAAFKTSEDMVDATNRLADEQLTVKLYQQLTGELKASYNASEPTLHEKFAAAAKNFFTIPESEQALFFRKIKAHSNIIDLLTALNKLIKAHQLDFSETAIRQLVEQQFGGAKIVFSDSDLGVMVVRVKSFLSSSVLGARSSWCISQYLSNWKEYVGQKNAQYFVYQFNEDSSSNNSMIGVTITPSGVTSAAHVKNDSNVKNMWKSLVPKECLPAFMGITAKEVAEKKAQDALAVQIEKAADDSETTDADMLQFYNLVTDRLAMPELIKAILGRDDISLLKRWHKEFGAIIGKYQINIGGQHGEDVELIDYCVRRKATKCLKYLEKEALVDMSKCNDYYKILIERKQYTRIKSAIISDYEIGYKKIGIYCLFELLLQKLTNNSHFAYLKSIFESAASQVEKKIGLKKVIPKAPVFIFQPTNKQHYELYFRLSEAYGNFVYDKMSMLNNTTVEKGIAFVAKLQQYVIADTFAEACVKRDIKWIRGLAEHVGNLNGHNEVYDAFVVLDMPEYIKMFDDREVVSAYTTWSKFEKFVDVFAHKTLTKNINSTPTFLDNGTIKHFETLRRSGIAYPKNLMVYLHELNKAGNGSFKKDCFDRLTPVVNLLLDWCAASPPAGWSYRNGASEFYVMNAFITFATDTGDVPLLKRIAEIIAKDGWKIVRDNCYYTPTSYLAYVYAQKNMVEEYKILLKNTNMNTIEGGAFFNYLPTNNPEILEAFFSAMVDATICKKRAIELAMKAPNADVLLDMVKDVINEDTIILSFIEATNQAERDLLIQHFKSHLRFFPLHKVRNLIHDVYDQKYYRIAEKDKLGAVEGAKELMRLGVPYSHIICSFALNGLPRDMQELLSFKSDIDFEDQVAIVDGILNASIQRLGYTDMIDTLVSHGIAPKTDYNKYSPQVSSRLKDMFKNAAYGTNESSIIKFDAFFL